MRLVSQKVDDKDQRRVRRYGRRTTSSAIGETRRDNQFSTPSHSHADDSPFPAFDNLTPAQREDKRFVTTPGTVENFAVSIKSADIVDRQHLTVSCTRAGTSYEIPGHKSRRRWANTMLDRRLFGERPVSGMLTTPRATAGPRNTKKSRPISPPALNIKAYMSLCSADLLCEMIKAGKID